MAAAEEGGGIEVRVNTLWVGETLPDWVLECVESYLRTDHFVLLWLYLQEERAADQPALTALASKHSGLQIRDASEIVPYRTARRMYYHGMGPEGKWRGWAPFSDFFRYEVIARHGGWWVDADGVSVRSLRGLAARCRAGCAGRGCDALVFCTERHRGDRRTVGAVAVVDPQNAASAPALQQRQRQELGDRSGSHPFGTAAFFHDSESGAHRLIGFHDWMRSTREAGLDVGLVTNSHFYAPCPGSPALRRLAQEMRGLLERYAAAVEARGRHAVRERDPVLKTGNVGMAAFQRMARGLAAEATSAGEAAPRVLPWSVFNPIDATDAQRMRRVLAGTEALSGTHVVTIHIFRQVRDDWNKQGLPMPALAPRLSDEPPPASRAHSAAGNREPRPSPAKVAAAERGAEAARLPRPSGSLLKRRRAAPAAG